MADLGTRSLVGQYFRPHGGVVSVFRRRDGSIYRLVRRYWPFLITKHTATAIECTNITTSHLLTLAPQEILGWAGDLQQTPHHLRPLVLKLDSQICWDATNLWRMSPDPWAFVA